jgi:hypothetical protein
MQAYDLLAAKLDLKLRVDHDEVLRCFESLDLSGLAASNQLSKKQNQRLAYSQDIHEIVDLLVRGLAACARVERGGPKSRR